MDFGRTGLAIVREYFGQGLEPVRLEAVNGALAGCAMDSDIGRGVPPVIGLGLDILKILKRSERPEILADVFDHVFHFTLFMGLAFVAGERDDPKGS